MKKKLQLKSQKHKWLKATTMNKLYANKMDNIEEMWNFLERFNLPRLNQEEIGSMQRSITSSETELVI